MDFETYDCDRCGGNLTAIDSESYKCQYCGKIFHKKDAEEKSKSFKDMFDEMKREHINNLRRNLYDAVNAEYISSFDVKMRCEELKKYLSDDFSACFYEVAVGNNVRQLTKYIRKIDVEKNYEEIECVVKFLIKSLQTEYQLELNNLIARAYEKRDPEKFEQFCTMLSLEAVKVDGGVYETKLPREVFIAYSSKDMEKVSELCEFLESQGLKCFVAARNLRHGKGAVENYNKALEEAMDHCKCIVFVSSMNSRNFNCDALTIELPYIQQKDIESAPAEYKNNYKGMPQEYKKPRVEYRIGESLSSNVADAISDEIFDGYERVYSPDEVAQRVMKQLVAVSNKKTPKAEPVPQVSYVEGAEADQQRIENILKRAQLAIDEGEWSAADAACERALDIDLECGKAYILKLMIDLRVKRQENLFECNESFEDNINYKKAIKYVDAETASALSQYLQKIRETKETERNNGIYNKAMNYMSERDYHSAISEFKKIINWKDSKEMIARCQEEWDRLENAIEEKASRARKAAEKAKRDAEAKKRKKRKAVVIAFLLIIALPLMGVFIVYPAISYANGDYGVCIEMYGLEEFTVPDGVTSIDYTCFNVGCGGLKSVTIPDSVTSIGSSAFIRCTNLETISIPDSVTYIDRYAFKGQLSGGCDKLKYNQYGNLKYLGTEENPYIHLVDVVNTSIESFEIHGNTKYIHDYAFSQCQNIKSVTIPDNIISIGRGVFYGCDKIISVTIPDGVKSIGDKTFYNCSSLTSIEIPDSVTSIGDEAFYNCSSLTSIEIPDSVTSIGDNAFYNCSSLTSIEIPDSVTSIGEYAFYCCSGLTSVTMPGSMTNIGKGAFDNCGSLTSVMMPDGVTSIGNKMFYNCSSLTSIEIPDGVTSIGDNAFYNCSSLTSIEIPDSVTSIGDNAFYNCSSLTSIEIPDSVTSIGEYAFYCCSGLTSVTMPGSMTNIGKGAFDNCRSLTSVTIPDSVTSIGESAFYGCSSLRSVTIPDGVTSVGDTAFYNCSSLVLIEYRGSEAEWNAISKGLDWDCYTGDYSITYNYQGQIHKHIYDNECDASCNLCGEKRPIEEHRYDSATDCECNVCGEVRSVGLAYESLGVGACYVSGIGVCTDLDIVIPSVSPEGWTVTSIGKDAFYGCSSLKSIEIPDSVKNIGDYAFYGCSSLKSIEIPDSVTNIGKATFYDCSSLTSVEIGDSVKSIGDSAFAYCSSLANVYITDIAAWCNILFYGYYANPLYYAKNLYLHGELVTELVIPDGVTSIDNYAFRGCSSLTSVTIPDSVTSIGNSAFYNCSSLRTVYYTGSEEDWAEISINSYNSPLTNATIIYNYIP